jgi:hypothetical protein
MVTGVGTGIGAGGGAGWKGRCGPNPIAASPRNESAVGVYAGGASSRTTSIRSLELEDCSCANSWRK